MNFSALTRSLLVGSALIAVTFAANAQVRQPTVFMLQFGSFETRDEAEGKIKNIGTKHGALLSKYPPIIREITMPPDNLTVYRTQAGPVDTRDTAQSVCSQLASQGDECYVVETAMAIPGAAPVIQQAGIIPTEEKPALARDPDNLKAIEKVATPMAEEKKAQMIQAMDEAAAPRTLAAAPAKAPVVEQVAEQQKKEGSFWSWLGGDDEASEADEWSARKLEAEKQAAAEAAARRAAPVDSVATHDMTPPKLLPAPAAPAVPAAPVVLAPVAQAPVVAPMATAPTEDIGILTPAPLQTLGGTTASAAPVAVAAAAPVVVAAPRTLAAAAPAPVAVEAPPVDIVEPRPSAFAPPAPVLAPQAAPQPAPQVVTAPAPIAPAEAQLGSQGLRLPPPPPPTPAARAALERGVAPVMIEQPASAPFASATPSAPVTPAPVLASTAPESTGTITSSNLPPLPFKKGASVTGSAGEGAKVEVGEAQRVPLSASQHYAPVEQLPAKVIGVNEDPELAPNTPPALAATPITPPSSTAIQKTLWAHIHYFPDQQAALSFWDGFRRAHPDFPVVRVRTTSSLVARQQGDLRVSLRVGPFGQPGFIHNLCASIQQRSEQLECGVISDMGASANAYAPRNRLVQATQASARFANKLVTTTDGFWVQIGTYPTMEAAELAWDDATTQHSDVLGGMKPAIISPEQGSQASPVFRLRTGPFTSQLAAKDVCSRVKVNSGSCLVVSE